MARQGLKLTTPRSAVRHTASCANKLGRFLSCLFGFQQFFSHITTVPGCDRELNAHFYSAASLKYHAPETWHDITSSHIILTLGRPVLALPRKVWMPREEQLVPFLTTLVCRCPGSKPWPPIPRSGHSTELPGLVDVLVKQHLKHGFLGKRSMTAQSDQHLCCSLPG